MDPSTAHANEDPGVDTGPAGPCSASTPDTVCTLLVVWQVQQLLQGCKLQLVVLHGDPLHFTRIPRQNGLSKDFSPAVLTEHLTAMPQVKHPYAPGPSLRDPSGMVGTWVLPKRMPMPEVSFFPTSCNTDQSCFAMLLAMPTCNDRMLLAMFACNDVVLLAMFACNDIVRQPIIACGNAMAANRAGILYSQHQPPFALQPRQEGVLAVPAVPC